MSKAEKSEANVALQKEPEKLKTKKSEKSDEKTGAGKKEEWRKFTEKAGEIAGKTGAALKTGAQKAFHFASSSAKLAKLKGQKSRLDSELHRTYLTLGKMVWKMHEDGKLPQLDSGIEEKFEKIDQLQHQISAKEQAARATTLVEGTKKK